jgi:hypothetical protein
MFDIRPAHTINQPLVTRARESEVFGDVSLWWWRNVAKIRRYGTIIVAISLGITDYESQDAVCRSIVDVSRYSAIIAHGDVLAFVVGKVDDNLVAFTLSNCETLGVYWM